MVRPPWARSAGRRRRGLWVRRARIRVAGRWKTPFRGAHEVDRPDSEPAHAIDVTRVSLGAPIHCCHAKPYRPQKVGSTAGIVGGPRPVRM